ncbi:MtrB/PioB family outer membrane beta-barrel protein, partial [Litorivivens sp.]|uniref:MtrB/PioB family outer membrane beta-barrel protein n=1 Tax=Litorivivens sp. TaxID=2020868 RepID=UPI003567A330
MITRPRIKTLYSIAICASSALAIADDSNSNVTGYVYVGSGYITDSQFKFGEYNALEEQGAYQVLDFRLTSPSVKQTQWSVTGENIGLSVPRLEATLSHAGNYGVYAEYSEFTHNRSNTGHTVFTSTDTSSLELPSDWVAANTTAGMSGLSGPLLSVKETLERKRLTLAYDWLSAPDNWSFDIAYMHETKEGNRVRYGVIGNTGGNPRAAALPTPVDFV